jgi:hypothetical protein
MNMYSKTRLVGRQRAEHTNWHLPLCEEVYPKRDRSIKRRRRKRGTMQTKSIEGSLQDVYFSKPHTRKVVFVKYFITQILKS